MAGFSIMVGLVLSLMVMPTTASAFDMGLVSTLVNKLGITESQAQGGSGAIFKTAEKRMSPTDYKQLASEVPEVDKLQKYAPESKKNTKDMIGKFTPIIYDYVKKNGSEMVMNLLQKALSF